MDDVEDEGVIDPSLLATDMLPAEHYSRRAPINAMLVVVNIVNVPRTIYPGTLFGLFIPLKLATVVIAVLSSDWTKTDLEVPTAIEVEKNLLLFTTRIA